MNASFCIHAHLYQPPREDPWLGNVLVEGSASPMNNWNERITRESYAPLGWARRLDEENRIIDLLNCYEWISFNVGPTLKKWLCEHAPEVLERMREGDEKSLKRLGHGNAVAQCYHHQILPLASAKDKVLETVWAIEDFYHTFGRAPEGMWLPECAADTPSLEVLAAHGIQFVILAPRQAKSIIVDQGPLHVDENTLDIREPYRIQLPSGNSITAVFYHGPLSQGIAFERLLHNGQLFWLRIRQEIQNLQIASRGTPLLCLATDGETYGHHFTFGEMALAHVLAEAATQRDNIHIVNIAAHIASNPPIREAVIHEPSSWSCVHGVERWRSDCGCSDGGHGTWNQKWRGPLRKALTIMRDAVDEHFKATGPTCFTDAEAALLDYGRVLADPQQGEAFAAKWFRGDAAAKDKAWKLLAMQEQALAAFASCAWFFDDISRIEPENAMTFALRALDLMRESNGPDVLEQMTAVLAEAQSNQPEMGNGKDIFIRDVLPRRDDPATLCLLAWILQFPEHSRTGAFSKTTSTFPNVSIDLFPQEQVSDPGQEGMQRGRAIIRMRHETGSAAYVWRIFPPSTEKLPGETFFRVEDCVMHVRPENSTATGEMEETSRAVRELGHPLRDYLLAKNLEKWERLGRPRRRAYAAHTVSITSPWLEGQLDVTGPEFWIGFIPYMLLESMLDDGLSVKQRMQVERILSLHLTRRSKSLARHLVTETVLENLKADADADAPVFGQSRDVVFAEWVRRVRFVMPDMDWWAVQNKVWGLGPSNYPVLARELGFANL